MISGKTSKELIQLAKKMIPPLSGHFHKGQAGRIAVVGGCEDYTGAPYFSAMASTLTGADMSHIICEQVAGQVIKTYSPNLMVHPYLYDSRTAPKGTTVDSVMSRVNGLLDRMHVLVIGPGMGRDQFMLDTAEQIINEAKSRNMPIVLDADGLYLINSKPDLIKGYKHAILTPNVVEFGRLAKATGLDNDSSCEQLCEKLGGVVIVQKGPIDYISNGKETLHGDVEGGAKRVSGQGDTLSGCLATFMAWKLAYQNKLWDHDNSLTDSELMLLAAFAASSITRTSSNQAFAKNGRATLTSDLTNNVGNAFSRLFT